MKLPFTTEDFFRIFGEYNTSVFPVQILFYILAGYFIYSLVKNKTTGSGNLFLVLGLFWVWMGLVYHILFFSKINPAAYIFGILFILQGALFIYTGLFRKEMVFRLSGDMYGLTGWIIILYGLVIYPVLGYLFGHYHPFAPELSAPCPTTIFTFGILLFVPEVKWWLLIIPGLWSLLGFTAALNLNVIQDFGLLAAGLVTVTMVILRKRTEIKL